jgi:hypothetical protein
MVSISKKKCRKKEEGDELPDGTVDLNADHIYSPWV